MIVYVKTEPKKQRPPLEGRGRCFIRSVVTNRSFSDKPLKKNEDNKVNKWERAVCLEW
jgi:hypothetical protein